MSGHKCADKARLDALQRLLEEDNTITLTKFWLRTKNDDGDQTTIGNKSSKIIKGFNVNGGLSAESSNMTARNLIDKLRKELT